MDVPAKLSARMRVYATGQGRKTDDTDAHSSALVRARMSGMREVVDGQTLEVLRLLVDRCRRIGEDHTRMVCQLHVLLLELIPGGAKKDLSAAQARALRARLAGVRPKDAAGKTRKRVALELVADLERIYARKKAVKRRLSDIVYRTMPDDLVTCRGTGPGGHRGDVSHSTTAGSHPHASSSDKSLPGPATTKSGTRLRKAS